MIQVEVNSETNKYFCLCKSVCVTECSKKIHKKSLTLCINIGILKNNNELTCISSKHNNKIQIIKQYSYKRIFLQLKKGKETSNK